MKHSLPGCSRYLPAVVLLLLLIPCASAFTVSPVTITPSGVLNPNDPVEVSCTVYAASGVAFPSYDDLQFVTELDDPVWYYTVVVNGVENVRPSERGKILTISGFELNYLNKDEVIVKMVLKAHVPATAAPGANKMMMKIQELDARSNVLPYSVVQVDHLIGLPTPTPTPAYGSIAVTSDPSGAGVYLDNAIKGITPVTLDNVQNGQHTVLLRHEGYQDFSSQVTVMGDLQYISTVLNRHAVTTVTTSSAGSTTTTAPGTTATATPWSPQPTAIPTTGILSITTAPSGALVYIDDQMKGITPAVIPGLSPGSHKVLLILDGYEDFKTTIEITPGTTSEFVTGLSQRKTLPGFSIVVALLAIGLTAGLLHRRIRKE
ncbi:MAG: hypothetical protein CVV32_02795 [Methanomicrobiales archaeon HGW-Methanomicrobiales-3]|jgi:PGF-CTERM protein|nr:MAG: hypothetical protein CVV32_02795 [Methanomicrobiales archaeon HGW-Methanomicrobiales-3]